MGRQQNRFWPTESFQAPIQLARENFPPKQNTFRSYKKKTIIVLFHYLYNTANSKTHKKWRT